jgi:hypothetical protein
MKKCKSCGKQGAEYPHYDGGFVCNDCIGSYFTCPACGTLFDFEDRVNGDQGNGFCRECTMKGEDS